MTTRRRRVAETAAILLIAVAWASFQVPSGANQTAHLATIVSVSEGSPSIDRHRSWTGDTAYIHGRFYAAKAPGLALWTVPYYVVLDRVGLVPALPASNVPFPKAQDAVPRLALWELALWGSMLPSLILLFVVRWVVNRLVPGYGLVAAITVGAAGVLAVQATMLFDHALSSCLGFGAFAILVGGRRFRGRALAAGVLAGLAVSVELPLALVAIALCVYLASRSRSLASVLLYAGGAVAGLVPLLAFDTWAFGSPFTLAYSHAVAVPGTSGHDVLGQNSNGVFGVDWPSAHGVMELLFSGYGLLVLAPIWAVSAYGLVLLARRGWKAEASLVAGIALLFLAYNSGYKDLFGAMTTGPRFLSAVLPFLALPVAAAWQRLPTTTASLAGVSIVMTWILVAGNPMAPAENAASFVHRLENSRRLSGSTLHWLGIAGPRGGLLAGLVLVLAAFTVALTLTPWHIEHADAVLALGSLIGWYVAYVAGTTLFMYDKNRLAHTGGLAMAAVVVAIVLSLVVLARRPVSALPGLLLIVLAWSRIDGKPVAALGLAVVAMAAVTVATIRPA